MCEEAFCSISAGNNTIIRRSQARGGEKEKKKEALDGCKGALGAIISLSLPHHHLPLSLFPGRKMGF